MRKTIIGVMGPGEGATAADCEVAFALGRAIASEGWVLLTGGRNVGVMDAASRGAKSANGLTIGILPTSTPEAVSEAVDLAIMTGLGSARNNINVLSCQVAIACGMGLGTAAEIALALKAGKPVILLNTSPQSQRFFKHLSEQAVAITDSPQAAIARIRNILKSKEF